ncbi:hypothetical protein [Dyella silvatica]|uniref:hypothetical protein n=1 Tax=Dyella silvatica TaxID=2992128 RepID=UPI00225B054D|nr:hypothetical protein [Dyella silvatica]
MASSIGENAPSDGPGMPGASAALSTDIVRPASAYPNRDKRLRGGDRLPWNTTADTSGYQAGPAAGFAA